MKSSNSYLKYVDIGYTPDVSKCVIASYSIQKAPTSRLDGLAFAGAVAAESSSGTWIDVSTTNQAAVAVSGKVFFNDQQSGVIKIAYPIGLFEPGNASQLLTVVAGNAFGLADVASLKLLDVALPLEYVRSFPGPKFGIPGIYERLGKKRGSPIIGSIVKPKCGLNADEHAEVCYQAWVGLADQGGTDGVDMVKDDEALTSHASFGSDFYRRIPLVIDAMKRAEDHSGCKKVYVPISPAQMRWRRFVELSSSLSRAEML